MRNNQTNPPQEPEEPRPSSAASPFASFEAALREEIETTETLEPVEVQPLRRRRGEGPKLNINWRFILRSLLNIAVLVALLGLVWALFFGPLTPFKDSLVQSAAVLLAPKPTATPAPTFTPIPPKPTRTPRPTVALWTDTPTASPTPGEATATPETVAGETATAPAGLPGDLSTATPTLTLTPNTSVEGCVPVENITKDDIGKTLCVTGRVFKVKQTTNAGLNVFSVQLIKSNGFLFVSYDRSWQVKENACVFATGEIKALGSSTTILLGYATPLEFCSP